MLSHPLVAAEAALAEAASAMPAETEPEPAEPEISDMDFFDQSFVEALPGDSDAAQAILDTVGDGPADAPAPVENKDDGDFDEETEDDRAIRQALIVGDFKKAVAKCVELGRMADAIMYSSCQGGELWLEMRALFFKQHKQRFVRKVGVEWVVGVGVRACVYVAVCVISSCIVLFIA